MTTHYPWVFEPCSTEDVCDLAGQPWAHAVRGRKPQRPAVVGYGHHPDDAERDATHKAHQQDAREVLGERGEVVTVQSSILPFVMCKLGTNYAVIGNEIQWIGNPLPLKISGLGSVWASSDFSMMPMGT